MDFALSLDQSLFHFINQVWTAEWADAFFPWITDLNKTAWFQFSLLPIVLGIFLWRFHRRGIAIFLFCLLAIAWSDFFGNQIKKMVERPRPFAVAELHVSQRSEAGGWSFISNHATNMFTFATFMTLMIPASAVPTFVLAFLVAYSRIYNGVHYPSDVLCGALFGVLWGYLFARLARFSVRTVKV